MGSLLNAHPEILIAHELDALGYVEHHFGRTQVFALLLERDRDFASMGRRWMGYDYVVPDQFQGRWTTLKVIGDKRARTAHLPAGPGSGPAGPAAPGGGCPHPGGARDPQPLRQRGHHGPAHGGGRGRGGGPEAPPVAADLADAIDATGSCAVGWRPSATGWGPRSCTTSVYETFVGRPAESLSGLCSFLGVDAGESFLADCAGVVWPQFRRRRHAVEWSEADRGRVDELIGAHGFLAGYSWDS